MRPRLQSGAGGRPSTSPLDARLICSSVVVTPNLKTIETIALVVGVLSALLGGLWLLQGLGLLHVRPILCFVDCEPIQGPSLTWAIAGTVVAALGSLGVIYSLIHRIRRSSNNRWRVP